jgi:hypothetical protein
MPVKSKKQRKFMAAVANNPKFAKKAGVSKSVGEEFMKKSTKKMMGGGMTAPAGGMGAMGGAPMGGAPMSEEEKRKRAMMAKMAASAAGGGAAPAPAAPSMGMKKGGQAKAYKKGGKVRGSGCATKGTRAAKMVTMKGS